MTSPGQGPPAQTSTYRSQPRRHSHFILLRQCQGNDVYKAQGLRRGLSSAGAPHLVPGPGPEGRKTVAHGVSCGLQREREPAPDGATDSGALTRAMLPRIQILRGVGFFRSSRPASRLRPRRNGEATSSSPFQSNSQGGEDIAAAKAFPLEAVLRWASSVSASESKTTGRIRIDPDPQLES